MAIGAAVKQGQFEDAALVLGDRLRVGSVYRLLADEGHRLFADDYFADLFVTTGTPGGSETILVVEDEAELRGICRRALEAVGYTVVDAVDGVDALGVARHHRGRIDLLLTDVVMPQLGGLALAQELLRGGTVGRVLYMSGYIEPEQAAELGGRLVSKPFRPRHLLRRVRAALDS